MEKRICHLYGSKRTLFETLILFNDHHDVANRSLNIVMATVMRMNLWHCLEPVADVHCKAQQDTC
jgi:hypothetical protein